MPRHPPVNRQADLLPRPMRCGIQSATAFSGPGGVMNLVRPNRGPAPGEPGQALPSRLSFSTTLRLSDGHVSDKTITVLHPHGALVTRSNGRAFGLLAPMHVRASGPRGRSSPCGLPLKSISRLRPKTSGQPRPQVGSMAGVFKRHARSRPARWAAWKLPRTGNIPTSPLRGHTAPRALKPSGSWGPTLCARGRLTAPSFRADEKLYP